MLQNLYEFKQEVNRCGAFFCFSGHISQELLIEIGGTIKHRMKVEAVESGTVIKVFSLLVEQAQNIIHYSKPEIDSQEDLKDGIIVVGTEQAYFFVSCGNIVNNESIPEIETRLSLLQRMTKSELKTFYKEQRRKGPPEGSKGAGLGFIELARKSSKPIEFYFKPVTDDISFFSLKTYI